MIRKFLLGLCVILLLYASLAWGVITLFQLTANQIKGIYISGIIASVNVVLAFLIIYFTIEKDQKTFSKFFLAGMAVRILLMLIAVIIIIKFSQLDHFVFIGSFFLLYFILQIWEVVVINNIYKRG